MRELIFVGIVLYVVVYYFGGVSGVMQQIQNNTSLLVPIVAGGALLYMISGKKIKLNNRMLFIVGAVAVFWFVVKPWLESQGFALPF